MAAACIVLLYISYAIPVICLLIRKRKIKHGPFWLGPFGLGANIVLLGWTLYCLVFYSFPATMPVTAGSKSLPPAFSYPLPLPPLLPNSAIEFLLLLFVHLGFSRRLDIRLICACPDMNYISPIYVGCALLISVYWWIHGKRTFLTGLER